MSLVPTRDPPVTLKKARVAWAREVLGIAPDADADEERRRVLQRLAEEDFVPSPEEQQAIETMLGRKRRLTDGDEKDDAFLRGLEQRLESEVKRFSAEFFDYTTAERQARFASLSATCAPLPVVSVRLKALEPGLKIDPNAVAGEKPPVRRLAEFLCRLLVLGPGERASLRREWRRKKSAEMGLWRKAARRLRAAYPDFAAMDGDFVAWLAEWSPRPARATSAANREARREAVAASRASSREEAGQFPWFIVVFVLFALTGAIRSCETSRQPPAPHRSPPSYRSPPYDVSDEDVQRGLEILRRLEERKRKSKTDRSDIKELLRGIEDVEVGPENPSPFPPSPRGGEWDDLPTGPLPSPETVPHPASPSPSPRLPEEGRP